VAFKRSHDTEQWYYYGGIVNYRVKKSHNIVIRGFPDYGTGSQGFCIRTSGSDVTLSWNIFYVALVKFVSVELFILSLSVCISLYLYLSYLSVCLSVCPNFIACDPYVSTVALSYFLDYHSIFVCFSLSLLCLSPAVCVCHFISLSSCSFF
jgi:hypothetical protein